MPDSFLTEWELWTENFSRRLSHDEHPAFRLLNTQNSFNNVWAAYKSKLGARTVLNFAGKGLRDSETGKFIAGIITARASPSASENISQYQEREVEGFRMICDCMPQLVSQDSLLMVIISC